ncbi:MAG TPA: GMC family oxidoreductase N-terminal domain-containing protein [Dongiaceae bacterium]|nr:GMC family oxidoreductase N-terminal domain-containing protein [Dongiaceae bacterium]
MSIIDPRPDSSPEQTKVSTEPSGDISRLKGEYDFIVCGAGSSGSVVARRLAEDPTASVLLIEAGGTDQVPEVSDPLLWIANLGSSRDWSFLSEPDPNLAQRQLLMSMGKVLGGGSSVNVMAWARGHRSDWDYFASEAKDRIWSHESICGIFRELENWQGESDPAFRGKGGPVWVQPPVDPSPIALMTLDAAESMGIERFVSQNGQMMEGAGGAAFIDMIIRDGKRQSIFDAYVRPYLNRPNLTVLASGTVQRLTIEGKVARGVQVKIDDDLLSLRARSEVIVSLGAINTPKILMLSGIGDEKQLEQHSIPLVQHLPGVGKNLQDHLLFPVVWSSREPIEPCNNGGEVTIYWRSRASLAAPDLFFCQVEFPFRSPVMVEKGLPEDGWTMCGGLAQPKSRGEIRLRSSDPADNPILDMKFLSHPDDMETILQGMKFARELGASAIFEENGFVEVLPGNLSDEEMRQFVRDVADTYHHQSCTAKMGTDAMSVVDGHLRVHGIERLRIVDASIMPRITTGNTMAPAVAIGEVASRLLKRKNQA